MNLEREADVPVQPVVETLPVRDWWQPAVTESVLEAPNWVTFNLETILQDTLENSPLIQGVSRRTSVALEKIVQQDAAFDPNLMFESRAGRKNDPVGSTLTTGGPPRLVEESLTLRGGIERVSRRGTKVGLSQEVGLLNSNSTFFDPRDQANSRLSLSLTQPLLSRSGQVYNERLLTQARIDSRVSWQEMRGDVEGRLADVIKSYWQLYEARCHLLQQEELLKRGHRIESIVMARQGFDAGRIELAKARQRIARRTDTRLQFQAEVQRQQARLASLIGSDVLISAGGTLELIPLEAPVFPHIQIDLRDAVTQGIESRPEVRAAVTSLESAALSIRITRAELMPQLTGVVDAYLAGLTGNYDTIDSFTDQFTRGGPGISAALRYDLPQGRRAAKSRHREAYHRYQQRSEEMRESIQVTKVQIETALINVNTAMAAQTTKQHLLETALDEEAILTRRWELMAGDGVNVGTVLETLLDAQQRRTDAEREWVSSQTYYLASLVELQRAMGTLLVRTGIGPVQDAGNTINFTRSVDGQVENQVILEGGMSR
ncbi:MAG: TolC family protein [Rubripirellula sp.]